VRLQKFLSRAGVASRRASERLIAEGRVTVDGERVTRAGSTVEPTQRIEVDGRRVEIQEARWMALHKPPGSLCTRGDPGGRPTVYDLLPPDARSLFHVGRLDYMSEGLLLLTNEGELANRLLHPSAGVRRRYEVGLLGPVPSDVPTALRRGVELEDGLARAVSADWTPSSTRADPVVDLVLAEGRNREIRRMMQALDLRVRYLKRVSFGPVQLGDLGRGRTRDLSDEELLSLKELVAQPGPGG
jgi:23S rRNA pseudouridine2605 synthase